MICPLSCTPTPVLRSGTHRRAGLTLVEMMVVVLVMGVLMGTAGSVLVSLQGAISEGVVSAVTEETARRALERIVEEVRLAQSDSVVLSQPTDARSITYAVVEGWGGTEPTVSAARTLAFNSATRLITLDAAPIAGDVFDVKFNLADSLLTITVEVRKDATVRGQTRTIASELVARLRMSS